MATGDKRIHQLTQIGNAPANGVLPIDVPNSEETNGITVDKLAKTMPVATSDRNGMMSSSFFNSIYYTSSTIEPNSTLDTGVITGGLIMFQNASSVHEVGIGIMYADGNGKVICEAGSISFFGGNGILDIRKGGPNESIKVVNKASVRQVAILRIICSYI